ncbi:MAG: metallophosphoesterase [Mongoliibacter sp.]|uniref:metallophosphoesterase n=1 Tax=Mongoliibacter sp. TaxID=2022438 RepID=UPI0012F40E6C|nr:metallophosphoesterase [Mongoliibacter sp.]TVP52782.1 MAG: metallophosphoesterase [Mongoliibacter sp.]
MSKLFSFIKAPIVFVLRQPIYWFAKKVSSAPDRRMVFERLSEMYANICENEDSKKGALYSMDFEDNNFIILSDVHKGNRSRRDEFKPAEKNYLAALDFYDQMGANYINLGDSEEFWKFNIFSIQHHNKRTFAAEAKFAKRKAFYKIFGNHDLFWKMDPFSKFHLKQAYGQAVNIYEGIVIRVKYKDKGHVDVFCTHGHQGDKRSDGNNFSKWFVSYIWGPLQAFLDININTPAVVSSEKTLHNKLMYEWSQEQENLVLITGHTHQPIFHSYNHIKFLKEELKDAEERGDRGSVKKLQERIKRHPSQCGQEAPKLSQYRPTYFNAGCCCYSDGSITGIEIKNGYIRLVRWADEGDGPERQVLEELPLQELKQMFFYR